LRLGDVAADQQRMHQHVREQPRQQYRTQRREQQERRPRLQRRPLCAMQRRAVPGAQDEQGRARHEERAGRIEGRDAEPAFAQPDHRHRRRLQHRGDHQQRGEPARTPRQERERDRKE
jgi:hypothetical protein